MPIHRQPPAPAIGDVSAAVAEALEHPLNFPSLRRALTPDDHVAIVVDEQLADLPRFLLPLLEHLVKAYIEPEAITFLITDADSKHEWSASLPTPFSRIRVEIHNPHNRKRLSYLATTIHGLRVYLNRTAVDADQLIVLSRRGYDPLLGISGAEGGIYPAFSDAETQRTNSSKLSMAAPAQTKWPVREAAAEIAWLLGAPFFIQIVEGHGNEIAHVIGGIIDATVEGQRLLDARWHIEVDEPAEVVIAEVGGDPSTATFQQTARALACASRVVQQDGTIILVCNGQPELTTGAQLLRQADTPLDALNLILEKQPADFAAAFQWASAAHRARLFVRSGLPAHVVEEMFATSLETDREVGRLSGGRRCVLIPDADKSLATCRAKKMKTF